MISLTSEKLRKIKFLTKQRMWALDMLKRAAENLKKPKLASLCPPDYSWVADDIDKALMKMYAGDLEFWGNRSANLLKEINELKNVKNS